MIAKDVTATISTKGRFDTTLPLVLTSILTQKLKPGCVIIYDDNDSFEDLRNNQVYLNLFNSFDRVNIKWEVKPGARAGQVVNHQQALQDVATEWIWRLDDDNVMNTDTLHSLYTYASSKPEVGAVGPLILDPKRPINNSLASNAIEDIYLGLNIQWCDTGIHSYINVDHLQGSTFLFRKSAAGSYNMALSKVGHREETMFTYDMKRNGWQLVVCTGVKTWHFHYDSGGIRSSNHNDMFIHDENIFRKYLDDAKVTPNSYKLFILNSGIGDHYVFRNAFSYIRTKYLDSKLIIGACYPGVFEDEKNAKIISIAEAEMLESADKHDVYRWMAHRRWDKSLKEAYKQMYTKT